MTDNFYFGCPAKSGPGFREVTNYAPNTTLNEYIAAKNQLNRDDEYRLYLQTKTDGNKEWKYIREKYSCFPNECIFDNKMTLVHPNTFNKEMNKWNSMPYVDSKGYFSTMNKKFNDRINAGTNESIYADKNVISFRTPYKCKKLTDFNAFSCFFKFFLFIFKDK